MTDTDELKETIELTDFLSTEQIKDLVNRAVRDTPKGYEARLEIGLLVDALRTRGFDVQNRFKAEGNSVIPKGTYEFLYENDLGEPTGTCGNYGCGHPIRYEEHIRHIESGREFVVGNVCVERLLGEHDLIRVATSLLARMSGKVERLNKAARCRQICGPILELVEVIDPNQWFTRPDHAFLEAIKEGRSGPTLKMAEELRAKWTPEAIQHLREQVAGRKHLSHPDANTDGWMTFLTYKKQSRPQAADFWNNCISATERDGTPTTGQVHALQGEFDRFWKITKGDESVLERLEEESGLTRWMARKMLGHSAKCRSLFHIGLLEQLLTGGRLTDNQLAALDQGCRMCGWKP